MKKNEIIGNLQELNIPHSEGAKAEDLSALLGAVKKSVNDAVARATEEGVARELALQNQVRDLEQASVTLEETLDEAPSELIREKMAAGLTRAQAEAVTEAQSAADAMNEFQTARNEANGEETKNKNKR